MSLTKAQLKHAVEEAFTEIDVDGNGYLSREELHSFFVRMNFLQPGSELDDPTFNAKFNAMDRAGDGRISFDELYQNVLETVRERGILNE